MEKDFIKIQKDIVFKAKFLRFNVIKEHIIPLKMAVYHAQMAVLNVKVLISVQLVNSLV